MGEIKDIMLDITTGNIDYFVIEFGGFLGIGIKYFAIPFRLLLADAKKKYLCLTRKKKYWKKRRVLTSITGRKQIFTWRKFMVTGVLCNH